MLKYHHGFIDFINTITPEILPIMKKSNWVLYSNGYVKDTNDTYANWFRLDGDDFPIILTLRLHFPWSSDDSKESINFKNEFNFKLLIDSERYAYLPLFDVELLDFEDIKSVKFTLDLNHKSKNIKRFTKSEIKQIVKSLSKILIIMDTQIKNAIKKQVNRRFNEIIKLDEPVALKYVSQEMKDIFLF